MSSYNPYQQALLWTCTSCGFEFVGGQPKMECPFCEAYKAAFIEIPQHLEEQVREAFPDNPHNHRDCRALRLELMEKEGVKTKSRIAGRVLPGASGNHMNPSTSE